MTYVYLCSLLTLWGINIWSWWNQTVPTFLIKSWNFTPKLIVWKMVEKIWHINLPISARCLLLFLTLLPPWNEGKMKWELGHFITFSGGENDQTYLLFWLFKWGIQSNLYFAHLSPCMSLIFGMQYRAKFSSNFGCWFFNLLFSLIN